MSKLLKVFILMLAGCLPQLAVACSDAYVVNWKPTQNKRNCSFNSYGYDGNYSGRKVINIGSGKVGQLIVEKTTCPYVEKLLFVDCSTAESVAVTGVLEPELQRRIDEEGSYLLGGDYLIKYIQPPFGPMSVSEQSSVQSIVAVAEEHDLPYTTSVLQSFVENNLAVLKHAKMGAAYDDPQSVDLVARAKTRLANRPFDLMCGCKRYYPDSVGALQ